MSEIKPVSSYEPVYQVLRSCEWEDGDKEDYDYFKRINENDVRILYPAAAYEALQKENASLKWQKDNVARLGLKANEALKADNEKLKECLFQAQNAAIDLAKQNAAQAKRIEELEAPSNPYDRVDLQGKLYIAGLQNQIESLRKQIKDYEFRFGILKQIDGIRKVIGS